MSNAESHLARAVLLTFTAHNSGVENKVIRMSVSGDQLVCIVNTVTRKVCHIRLHNTPSTTPLLRVYTGVGQHTHSVTPAPISRMLRGAVKYLGSRIGFLPSNVSVRSLRTAGPMALRVNKGNPDIIQMLGRWRLDNMFRYLHDFACTASALSLAHTL